MGNTQNIGQIIRTKRIQNEMTLEQLGNIVGVGKSTVRKWEQGMIKDMKSSNLKAIAKILNISPTVLLGLSEPSMELDTVELPILGDVAAGTGSFADNTITGYEKVPKDWIGNDGDYALLRVTGESMYPKFEEDDLLLVRCQSSVDSGDYAVAIIDGERGVVKKVVYDKDYIELQSINPMYPPRRFEGEDVLRVRIFGLVKKSIRTY